MKNHDTKKIEFGDFQTPFSLAEAACIKLRELGIKPEVIIEPTCGIGAFLLSSIQIFKDTKSILGYEIESNHISVLNDALGKCDYNHKVNVKQSNFFDVDWTQELSGLSGNLLVIGNFPWVTNSGIGAIGGKNLPDKSNFLKHSGFDAISGKANFDISEWMMLEVLKWFEHRSGAIGMLLKTAVARKILAHARRQNAKTISSHIYKIDTKREFNASVDSCLLVMIFDTEASQYTYDYEIYDDFEKTECHTVGYRQNLAINDVTLFDKYSYLFGKSPVKWRSGVKHDCSSVMELSRLNDKSFVNRSDDNIFLETDYIYPLLKGSDIGSNKKWREKFVIVTQRKVGEDTKDISEKAPNTWKYLNSKKEILDARGSSIYEKNPQFSVFGVGEYAFLDWKIAICALYKKLEFRLIEPIEGKTVMFDDTVYYISFQTKKEAEEAFAKITSIEGINFLKSIIFFDDKRPIKTSILNSFDWTQVKNHNKVV